MKKTRIIAVLALVLIVAMLFAGCSNGAPQTTPNKAKKSALTGRISLLNAK